MSASPTGFSPSSSSPARMKASIGGSDSTSASRTSGTGCFFGRDERPERAALLDIDDVLACGDGGLAVARVGRAHLHPRLEVGDHLVRERHQAFAFDAKSAATQVESGAAASIGGLFTESASRLGGAFVPEPYSSLLHGVVHGVPVTGGVVADQRPAANEMTLAYGQDSDDLAAVFAAADLGIAKPEDRRDVERLLSAFTHDLLSGMATSNGIVTVEESEHASAFSSRPGEPGPAERVLASGAGHDLPGTRAARSAAAGTRSSKAMAQLSTELYWSKDRKSNVKSHTTDTMRMTRELRDTVKEVKPPASRLVRRPTPRYFEPMEPMLAVRGVKRSLRHRFDRHRSPDGRLQCRWPSQVSTEIEGLVRGADLVAAFPAGGIPPEVVRLVENAMILDPYIAPWRGEVAAKAP